MARKLFIVAAMAVLALSLSGEAFALEISGKVFWNETVHDSGAADVMVLCFTPAHDTLRTTTNCCGEYSFDVGPNENEHQVWAHHIHIVKEPCPVSGPECWKEVETGKKKAFPPDDDVNFDLELDCGNNQYPCS